MLKQNSMPLSDRGCIHTTVLYIIIGLCFFLGMWCSLNSEALPQANGVEVQKGWLQLAALALSAGVSIYKGIKQNKAAKDLEKINQRPEYRISQGTRNNIAIAKAAANEGTPLAVQNNYLNQLNLGTASALRNNLLYGRGNTNTNSVMRAYNEGISQINAQDAQAMQRNRGTLMEANAQLAEEEQRAFQSDMQTYRDKANWAAQLRSAGNENIMGGLGAGLGAIASGAFNPTAAAQPTGAPLVAKTSALKAVPDIAASARGLGYWAGQDYNNSISKQLSNSFLQKPVENSDFWWGNSRGMFRNK